MQTTAREIAEAVQDAIATERERCAKIAELSSRIGGKCCDRRAESIAAVIRKSDQR